MSGGSTQGNAVTAAYYRGYAKACEDARRDLLEPGHAHLLEAAEILRMADRGAPMDAIERHHAWLDRDDKLPPAPEPSTPAAKAGDGWIRCRHGYMPLENTEVLTCVAGDEHSMMVLHRHDGMWFRETGEDLCDDTTGPTHWMPLPAPPSPETNGEA